MAEHVDYPLGSDFCAEVKLWNDDGSQFLIPGSWGASAAMQKAAKPYNEVAVEGEPIPLAAAIEEGVLKVRHDTTGIGAGYYWWNWSIEDLDGLTDKPVPELLQFIPSPA